MLPITSAESGIRRFDKCQIGTTAIGWARVCGTSAAWQFCARGRWLGRLLPAPLKRTVGNGADVDWRADLTKVSHRNRFKKRHHRTKRTWSRVSQTSSPAQLRIKIKLREQDIDFFDYTGEFEPPPLTNKNVFTRMWPKS